MKLTDFIKALQKRDSVERTKNCVDRVKSGKIDTGAIIKKWAKSYAQVFWFWSCVHTENFVCDQLTLNFANFFHRNVGKNWNYNWLRITTIIESLYNIFRDWIWCTIFQLIIFSSKKILINCPQLILNLLRCIKNWFILPRWQVYSMWSMPMLWQCKTCYETEIGR